MTINEAIVHAREVAEENRKVCNLAWIWNNADNIKKCAEEHEQLAEWLEELKAIKDGGIPIVHGQEELKLHDKQIRSKAIDDFANTLKQKYSCLGYIDVLAESDIDEIAKQLKAGDGD